MVYHSRNYIPAMLGIGKKIMSVLSLHPDIADRVETARHIFNSREVNYKHTENDFLHYIFMLGLLEYELRIQPTITGKPYKPYKAKSA
jgi:hypothetical protein